MTSTDRIDHAAEAMYALDVPGALIRNDGTSPEGDRMVQVAQVHATLALVEQRRIANLIALAGSRHSMLTEQVAQDAANALAEHHSHSPKDKDPWASGWHELRPDIAAALGLPDGADR